MRGSYKKRAPSPVYTSPNQLSFEGFETPFEQHLDLDNRWVFLARNIPWDRIVGVYDKVFSSTEGRKPLSGRLVLGSLMIKHLCKLSDRETIISIQENMYMQYFLGYTSFTTKAPFSATLFVEFRKRLTEELLAKINDIVATHAMNFEAGQNVQFPSDEQDKSDEDKGKIEKQEQSHPVKTEGELLEAALKEQDEESDEAVKNEGQLLMDATVSPQNITYPTDLKLLNVCREKCEQLIDAIYIPGTEGKKPRTYRNRARKDFLNVSKKKRKSKTVIRGAIRKQLGYVKRDLKHIETLLSTYKHDPLTKKQRAYLCTIKKVYAQQLYMYENRTHTVEDRIVNLHQPYVRPIVRGKEKSKVEFGAKIQASLVKGFVFLDHVSWDAFNESSYLLNSVEKYKKRFGYYPYEVLADQIYCTRENRKLLKEKNIKLVAKPLGRPSAQAVKNHVRPGERNPIEGKFGQAKTRYGMDNIKAKLANTSTSWIATIALVLNLVRMTRQAPVSLILRIQNWLARYVVRLAGNFGIKNIYNMSILA